MTRTDSDKCVRVTDSTDSDKGAYKAPVRSESSNQSKQQRPGQIQKLSESTTLPMRYRGTEHNRVLLVL